MMEQMTVSRPNGDLLTGGAEAPVGFAGNLPPADAVIL
jgi:hypothetical protein